MNNNRELDHLGVYRAKYKSGKEYERDTLVQVHNIYKNQDGCRIPITVLEVFGIDKQFGRDEFEIYEKIYQE